MPTLTSPALPALRIEAAINDLMGKGEFLDHHVEHALASIDDHIANMIAKLEKREDKSESRIGDLESVSPPPASFVPFSLDLTLHPLPPSHLSADHQKGDRRLSGDAPQPARESIEWKCEPQSQRNGN
jgi:hypothetical protein